MGKDYKHQLIKTNGVTLNVVQSGPADGPLVILLHGFPEFWYGWRNQIDALTALGLRVWVPDQRGYNLSDKPDAIKAYRLEELTGDVVGLIRAAGVERAAIVGHDWGAVVAWGMALYHPEKVEKLGILNVPHPLIMQKTLRSDIGQAFKSWYAMMFQIPWMPEKMMALGDWEFALRAIRSSGKPDTFSEADLIAYRESWSQPDAMRAMINWYRAYVQHPPAPPADWRVHVPTLMIWGAQDKFLSAEMAQPSIDMCDDGQLIMIESATHWVQHDEPERVNQLLGDFLR